MRLPPRWRILRLSLLETHRNPLDGRGDALAVPVVGGAADLVTPVPVEDLGHGRKESPARPIGGIGLMLEPGLAGGLDPMPGGGIITHGASDEPGLPWQP